MTLRFRLFISHAAVILLTLAVMGVALFVLLAQLQAARNATDMLPDVMRVSRAFRQGSQAADAQAAFDRVAAQLGSPRLRLLLIEPSGEIVDDSATDAQAAPKSQQLDLKSRSPQIVGARDLAAAGEFRDVRNRRWEFIAFPYRPNQGSDLIAVARIVPQGPLFDLLEENVAGRLLLAGVIALGVAAIVAALVARSISKPIQRVAQAANAIAQGNYDERVVIRGPTEFSQLAGDFNYMADEVQAARRREREFLANVTHELKTPLTSIQGFAQAITDGAVQAGEPTQHAAQVIYDEAERLRRLVGGLLVVSRLESGESRLARNVVNVNDVLAACVKRFDLRAREAHVRLALQAGDAPPIRADGDRIAQVFTNLIDNALKYTPAGGSVVIETRRAGLAEGQAARATPDGVEIVVADTGRGIPADDLPHIFDRFFRAAKPADDFARAHAGNGSASQSSASQNSASQNSASQNSARVVDAAADDDGVGLGLAICKQIVEAHGGTITAQSALGIGTRLRVWLPQ